MGSRGKSYNSLLKKEKCNFVNLMGSQNFLPDEKMALKKALPDKNFDLKKAHQTGIGLSLPGRRAKSSSSNDI